MTRLFLSSTGVSLAFFLAACSSNDPTPQQTGAGGSSVSAGGSNSAGGSKASSQTGPSGGSTTTNSSSGPTGAGGSTATSGPTGSGGSTATSGPTGAGGSTATSGTTGSKGGSTGAGGSTGTKGGNTSAGGSSAGPVGGQSSTTPAGGSSNVGGTSSSSAAKGGAGGATEGGAATGGTSTVTSSTPLTVFTSDGKSDATNGKAATVTEGTGNADVTVNDATAAQNWDGWGGAFNELGWSVLNSAALQEEAMKLLFDAEQGAHFNWGRIPMGASDYSMSRYTVDDPAGPDPTANGETARPAGDTNLGKFSLSRDEEKLIPYIKAAQLVRTDLKFWASPWTAPVWMKTGYNTKNGDTGGTDVKKPSYFDGGTMKSDAAILTSYAQLFTKFVKGYKDKGINIEIVSPQNEPGYEQNYPSCLWDKATYTSFIGKYLGPAMKDLGVKLMLGTMSNNGDTVAGVARKDTDIADTVLADSTAKGFIAVAGAQWGVLGAVVGGYNFGGVPIWATEHKCGNYPWEKTTYKTSAPNDLAYAVESWGYIRDAITKGKVTAYNAWNMVLDAKGLGIDTSRDWAQNALLTVSSGKITKTPTYWVFRHASQFSSAGGSKVVGTTNGSGVESFGFKNADGSLVAVVYNTGAAKTAFIVSIGGKKVQFAMPAAGWATVYVPKS